MIFSIKFSSFVKYDARRSCNLVSIVNIQNGDVCTRAKLDELNWMRLTVFLRFPRFGFHLRDGVTSRNRSILEDTSFQFVPVNGAGLRSMVQDG